jgi:hypothetical protein
LNVAAFGGKVKLITLTPPGDDLLARGDETRPNNGHWMVEWADRERWNATAQKRASRLFEAAQRAADRHVLKLGAGSLPRQIGNVRSEQQRGVWHFHYLLPYETEVERTWSKTVERFLDHAWKNDQRRWPDEAKRRELIWLEYAGTITRGFYGFGYVHAGNPAGKTSERASGYMARNAAGYMARNVAGIGRHYVNGNLIRQTGVTMRALRATNWLYVRRKLIDADELQDDWLPGYWSDVKRAETLKVWAMLQPAHAP